MRLKGKVSVITGGSSGIGLAIAREFKKEGASVAIFGRSKKRLEYSMGELGPDCLAVKGDVRNPGPIDTPIYGKLGFPDSALESMAKDIAAQNPMKRFGTPDEMAKAALFLASSDSSYLAGAELVADGGVSQI